MPKKTVAGTRADPTIRFADLMLDGTVYQLAYDFNSIALAEKIAGINLLEGLRNLAQVSAQQFRGLFYGARLKAQPEITLEQAGGLIRLDTLLAIEAGIAQAYANSIMEKKEETEDKRESEAELAQAS